MTTEQALVLADDSSLAFMAGGFEVFASMFKDEPKITVAFRSGRGGRIYYAASTIICVPASLSQEVGLALGAQAGETRLREVVMSGGFTRFRRATATPFNLVLETRP